MPIRGPQPFVSSSSSQLCAPTQPFPVLGSCFGGSLGHSAALSSLQQGPEWSGPHDLHGWLVGVATHPRPHLCPSSLLQGHGTSTSAWGFSAAQPFLPGRLCTIRWLWLGAEASPALRCPLGWSQVGALAEGPRQPSVLGSPCCPKLMSGLSLPAGPTPTPRCTRAQWLRPSRSPLQAALRTHIRREVWVARRSTGLQQAQPVVWDREG